MSDRLPRRAVLAGALALPFLPCIAAAQADWPRRPVRVVVPYAPGGATDSSIRVISDRLAAALGQSIVVENRSGGSGLIGAGVVAQAAPDGYTFLMEGLPSAVNPFMLRNAPFDYRTAFVPVTQVTRLPLALVVKADLPARTVQDFVELAKRRPGELSCGYSGNGTGAHLAGVLLQLRAGIQMTALPYRGGADAVRDLAAGALDCATVALLSAAPVAQSGRIRILAVTSPRRSPLVPGLPTLLEGDVPDSALEEWMGLFAVAGTPQAVLDRMASAVAASLREPDVVARLAQLGAEPVGSTPAEFAAFVVESRTAAERLVREGRIEAN
jgi:tripartite-type tricarboxylate transporter receptor subunit TctC